MKRSVMIGLPAYEADTASDESRAIRRVVGIGRALYAQATVPARQKAKSAERERELIPRDRSGCEPAGRLELFREDQSFGDS